MLDQHIQANQRFLSILSRNLQQDDQIRHLALQTHFVLDTETFLPHEH